MPKFSQRSLDNLKQAHPDIQKVMNEAIKRTDFSVICGYRGEAEQTKAFNDRTSKARFGQSPHNFAPSLAVDVVPSPLDWNDIPAFQKMAGVIKSCAEELGIELSWGGDWKSFKDYPHFELKDWKERV